MLNISDSSETSFIDTNSSERERRKMVYDENQVANYSKQ